jgi:hypothetical protein
MIASEGLAAVGRTIAAHHRSDGTAADHEIAWVNVALGDLEGHRRCLIPDGFRASAVVDRCGLAGTARYVAAPASLLALANSRQTKVMARSRRAYPDQESAGRIYAIVSKRLLRLPGRAAGTPRCSSGCFRPTHR